MHLRFAVDVTRPVATGYGPGHILRRYCLIFVKLVIEREMEARAS